MLELDGGLILQEASEKIGTDLPDDGRYETLGGLVLDLFGRLPQRGDSAEVAGHRIEVGRMADHRIERVRLTRLEDPAEPDAGL